MHVSITLGESTSEQQKYLGGQLLITYTVHTGCRANLYSDHLCCRNGVELITGVICIVLCKNTLKSRQPWRDGMQSQW